MVPRNKECLRHLKNIKSLYFFRKYTKYIRIMSNIYITNIFFIIGIHTVHIYTINF